ncbi:MAG TPA: hypothetical protein VK657_14420 [Terriglobales bacterium]|nr:hypothetical protein [Terriglobales bacterium]
MLHQGPELRSLVTFANVGSLWSQRARPIEQSGCFIESLLIQADESQAGDCVGIVWRAAQNVCELSFSHAHVLTAQRLEAALFVGLFFSMFLLCSQGRLNVLQFLIRVALQVRVERGERSRVLFFPEKRLAPFRARLLHRTGVMQRLQQLKSFHARFRIVDEHAREPQSIHFIVAVAGAEPA